MLARQRIDDGLREPDAQVVEDDATSWKLLVREAHCSQSSHGENRPQDNKIVYEIESIAND